MAKAVDVTVVIPHLLFRKKICVLRVAILHRIFAKNYIILLLAARLENYCRSRVLAAEPWCKSQKRHG